MSITTSLTRSRSDIEAPLAYLADDAGATRYRVWPLASSREPESPQKTYHSCRIADCRPLAARLRLDTDGFVLREHATAFSAYLDDDRIRADYYPEIEAVLAALTGASAVVVFDHNVRSANAAAAKRPGVRAPVDMVHGDYSLASGSRRCLEILQASKYTGPTPTRTALVNVWRPLHGPVVDIPLAMCHAGSVAAADLVATPIEHYDETAAGTPRLTGEILSVRHNATHRWFYASNMQADEIFIFKGYDSKATGVARATPHTGFTHPDRPPEFIPRESIEVRALLIDHEPEKAR